jgi:hypothetical protein
VFIGDVEAVVGEVLLVLTVRGAHAEDLPVTLGVQGLDALALVGDLRALGEENRGSVFDPADVGEVLLSRTIEGVYAVDLEVALRVRGLLAEAAVGDLLSVGREGGRFVAGADSVVGQVLPGLAVAGWSRRGRASPPA